VSARPPPEDGGVRPYLYQIDELRSQLAAANQRTDAANELVRYVKGEKELQQDRRQRERMKEHAGILRRSKWWVFGMPERENATEGADSEL